LLPITPKAPSCIARPRCRGPCWKPASWAFHHRAAPLLGGALCPASRGAQGLGRCLWPGCPLGSNPPVTGASCIQAGAAAMLLNVEPLCCSSALPVSVRAGFTPSALARPSARARHRRRLVCSFAPVFNSGAQASRLAGHHGSRPSPALTARASRQATPCAWAPRAGGQVDRRQTSPAPRPHPFCMICVSSR